MYIHNNNNNEMIATCDEVAIFNRAVNQYKMRDTVLHTHTHTHELQDNNEYI